jgi:O-acetylhomoserine/O-acetylserine sulfhydrylase-like pyridoxal-dependent enzyme
MEDQEKLDTGVTAGMIRLSVGLEHVEDLQKDIQQSMDASPAIKAAL